MAVRCLYGRPGKESLSFPVEMWASGPWLDDCRCLLRSGKFSSSDWGYNAFKRQCGREELQLGFAHAVPRDPDTEFYESAVWFTVKRAEPRG